MFVDETILEFRGGKGGNGVATFFPGIQTGPSGGDGGRGGSVYVRGNQHLRDLHRYAGKTIFSAENGTPGANFTRDGQKGNDKIVILPIGTSLTDMETGNVIEVTDITTEILIARGGRGGKGNTHFATPTHRSPRKAEAGRPGQRRIFNVVLRLIADFGLIGLPNAGKSSILNELTAAQVKVGAYPFTTLEPNLGALDHRIIADVPGLIEGASTGRGLGIKFLKHIEKVKILLHCIAVNSPDPIKDFHTIINELGSYNEELVKKQQIIILTKTDLVEPNVYAKVSATLSKLGHPVLPVSIYNPDEFTKLREHLLAL